jgi:hypothetical protein
MRMPKKNEHGDVFLRVRIYETAFKRDQHNTRDSFGYHVITN